jgi:hypothetical protein
MSFRLRSGTLGRSRRWMFLGTRCGVRGCFGSGWFRVRHLGPGRLSVFRLRRVGMYFCRAMRFRNRKVMRHGCSYGMNAVVGHDGFFDHHAGGAAVVDGGELGAIGAGCVLIFDLGMHRRCMGFTQRGQFRWTRAKPDAALAAVEAYPNAARGNGVAVDVVDHGDIDVVHGAVIEKVAGVPIAALVAGANITKPVVDAAIEADVRTPIAMEESITAAHEAPVARRP